MTYTTADDNSTKKARLDFSGRASLVMNNQLQSAKHNWDSYALDNIR